MKKILLLLILAAIICASAGCISANPSSPGEIVITNSDGSTVTLEHPPERIVLLNSNAGEILYILGDADKIIGITQSIANDKNQAAMYPEAVVIGKWNEPDIESLVSLGADLVVGYATSKPINAEVLEDVGIPIVYIDCTKPETFSQDVIEIGKISGNITTAQEIAEFYDGVVNDVKNRTASLSENVSVYAEGYSAYQGQGTDTGMGQIIAIAGGKNIMTDTSAKKISDEWVVTSNPEIIIKLVSSSGDAQECWNELITRTGFDTLDAVTEHNTWVIKNHLTYGPRSCATIAAAAKLIHPEAFADVEPELILESFNLKFGTNFETESIVYPN